MNVLERFLSGEFAVTNCATEQDFYALWQTSDLGLMSPTSSAIVGGLLADRLSWVFTAGYQATLRNAFTMLPLGGWAAFAATEDIHDRHAHPPTTLCERADGYRLNGCKSWVAHSQLVDHLIVTVNDPGGDKRQARGVVLERHRAGIVLSHRADPAFLKPMSQGFAQFNDTPVAAADVFEFEPIRQFGRTEAKFVMLACTAFMLARSAPASELQSRLLTTAASLLALIAESTTSRQVYAAIDREFQRCVDSFIALPGTPGIADFAADERLLRMYSAKIQRRGEYAKAQARSA